MAFTRVILECQLQANLWQPIEPEVLWRKKRKRIVHDEKGEAESEV